MYEKTKCNANNARNVPYFEFFDGSTNILSSSLIRRNFHYFYCQPIFCPLSTLLSTYFINDSLPILCVIRFVFQDFFCHKSTVILCSFNFEDIFNTKSHTFQDCLLTYYYKNPENYLKRTLNTRQNACACP